MTEQPHAAADAGRYHPGSAIGSYLTAASAAAQTPEMLAAAAHERWVVKTGCDADAQALTTQVPTSTSITALTSLPVPPVLPPDGRSDGAEKTVWELTATLQGFCTEADGDVHMVLADGQGNTMIAEIPDPGDITGSSCFASQIAAARTAFDTRFQIVENTSEPAGSGSGGEIQFQEVTVPVTVTGLGYFDFAHGQRGVAPNAIELHPVVNIVFNG